MAVSKGRNWGTFGPLADGAPVVRSDAELADLVESARRAARPVPEVGLLGGDLCRTVGGQGNAHRLRRPDAARLAVDVVRVDLDGDGDGSPRWFVAHLVAHRWAWRGRVAVAMNAEWLGPFKLGPRAHPGDGLVDVTVGALGWRDRLQARSRARTGDHLPHPALRTSRAAQWRIELDRATAVWLDGRPAGRHRRLDLTVEPEAVTIVV